ncbi:hypothetical protein PV04_01816 [Phialophora macrospora]|uniref:Uncharacterized protein n=1 Tax=Phialophora macrospora TaxID=1851006 RepID=A0A0D2D801_9EURO|nr:hypothetical protein PV04_01816 [Phialophora macrospora]
MPPPQRPITRILIANRGEIAIRILQSCHELSSPPTTFALYTDNDSTHVSLGRPHHAIKAPSPASYMNIDYLIGVVRQNQIDAVHPGYGFLSESAEFSRRMWTEAECVVVGPGWEVLERTGDKLMAKALAAECGVPVLKAMDRPTGSAQDVRRFAEQVGYPLMIKAVDGGGGRGIRLVRSGDALLENAVQRCVGESPSRLVFAEQAAVDGYKHVEIQIIGDGRGGVKHLWERDCSVQRRFQKIVEVAPAPVQGQGRAVVAQVIDSAVRMAMRLKYLGLGTWEYLVNVRQNRFFFLEINPRLQVEHTITECIAGVDLVKEQLLLAQGVQTLENIPSGNADKTPPRSASIQLRLCAEDPLSGFSLSIGKVTDIQLPTGNGVRVDSHLSRGGVVGSDFDNMMAKIIVTSSTFGDCVVKARRALEETKIAGVKTNLNLLKAILADKAFASGEADTSWLETNLERLVQSGEQLASRTDSLDSSIPTLSLSSSQGSAVAASATPFRRGDAWTVVLEDPRNAPAATTKPPAHHLAIERVTRNEFPEALIADVSYTIPGQQPQSYKMTLNSTTSSADATASTHRRGDPGNKSHIILPMSGKLVEVLVDEGDEVKENQVIAFVKQMKMELEVRSPRAGTVKWAIEMENEDGDDVAEGVLLVELEEENVHKPEIRARL